MKMLPPPVTPRPEADAAAAVSEAAEAIRRRGKPTLKLTADVIAVVCAAVEKGAGVRLSCQAAGISTSSFSKWTQLGRQGREPYASFVAAVDEARRACRMRMEQLIASAAVEDWRAAKYWLGVHDPEWVEKRDGGAGLYFGEGSNQFQIEINLDLPKPPPGITWEREPIDAEAQSLGMSHPLPIPNLTEELPAPEAEPRPEPQPAKQASDDGRYYRRKEPWQLERDRERAKRPRTAKRDD